MTDGTLKIRSDIASETNTSNKVTLLSNVRVNLVYTGPGGRTV